MGTVRIIRGAAPEIDQGAFAADVRRGLTAPKKRLSCRWFYDDQGSRLFEEICRLPEYTIPQAEAEILTAAAPAIAALAPRSVVELGSGNAEKTRILLGALDRATFVPIDISAGILEETARVIAAAYPAIDVVGIAGTYEHGLALLGEVAPAPRLVLWLGSNVGNFTREGAAVFLTSVRRRLAPGDRLLMGVDLRKAPDLLRAAYDDSQGVTARFNLNLLERINRELSGHFDLSGFRHRADYLEDVGRVEMHLVSTRPQRVRIDALELEVDLAAGETIHTEDSYKYSRDEIGTLAAAAGLALEQIFADARSDFCDALLAVPPGP
jgi:dimethylhistidine N-methyltransferase